MEKWPKSLFAPLRQKPRPKPRPKPGHSGVVRSSTACRGRCRRRAVRQQPPAAGPVSNRRAWWPRQSSRFACRSKVAPARRDPTGACSLPCLGLFFVPITPSVSTVALPDACSPDGCPRLSGPAGLERGAGSRSTIERGAPPLDPASPLKGGGTGPAEVDKHTFVSSELCSGGGSPV